MTDLLQEAFAKAADLPAAEQDVLASRLLAELAARHDEDCITVAMDAVIDEVGAASDDFTREAARQALRR